MQRLAVLVFPKIQCNHVLDISPDIDGVFMRAGFEAAAAGLWPSLFMTSTVTEQRLEQLLDSAQ
jgi:hypothetical protein